MKLKHTPGPWIYDPDNDRYPLVVRDNDTRIIAHIEDNRAFPLPECEANAKLIAAAPELLEALMYARDDLNMILGQKKELAKLINDAIEKAIK